MHIHIKIDIDTYSCIDISVGRRCRKKVFRLTEPQDDVGDSVVEVHMDI